MGDLCQKVVVQFAASEQGVLNEVTVSAHVFRSWRHVVGAGSLNVNPSCLPLRARLQGFRDPSLYLAHSLLENGASFTATVWSGTTQTAIR